MSKELPLSQQSAHDSVVGSQRLKHQQDVLADLLHQQCHAEGKNPQSLLSVLEAGLDVFSAQHAACWLLSEELSQHHFSLAATAGLSDFSIPSKEDLSTSSYSVFWDVIKEKKVWPIHDIGVETLFGPWATSFLDPYSFKSLLVVGLFEQGKLLGALTFSRAAKTEAWFDDEKKFATMLGDWASIQLSIEKGRARQNLFQKSDERFKFVARATNDLVWDWDMVTGEVWWNEGIRGYFGYDRDAMVPHIDWWQERVHPDDRLQIDNSLSLTSRLGGSLWSSEYRFQRSNGSYSVVYDRGYLMRNADGKPIRMIRAMTDVSERKRLESRMVQSEKMTAMGHLAAGVAHEINNPLGVILGFAQAALRRTKGDDTQAHPLRSIEREAIRCKDLVSDLLTFSRHTSTAFQSLDVNRVINTAMTLIQAQAKMADITVEERLQEGLPAMMGNANQVQQLVVNLANNAFDAMPKGGTLTIRTDLMIGATESWVVIRVEDTGEGIPLDVQERIFDPFFTTKPVGQGTGLGLSLVYEIVKKHAGAIDLQSVEGTGTEFILRFPVYAEAMDGDVGVS